MKGFLNRDYVENFVKFHKKTIIKVVAGFVLFAAAFFVFCIRDSSGGDEFKLSDGDGLQKEINGEIISDIEAEAAKEAENEESKADKKNIFVDISGAVNKPYVYEFEEGTRIYEAIEKAGGLTMEADVSNLNLAMILSDQDKITVFTKKDIAKEIAEDISHSDKMTTVSNPQRETVANGKGGSNNLININIATETELQTITGIGPSTAEKIISYRMEHGKFKKIEELMNVSGIGEKTFAKFKDKITV